MSALSSRLRRTARELRPQGRAWLVIVAATVTGLLLFLLLWLGRDELTTSPAPLADETALAGDPLAPLPAPLPAGDRPASGVDYPAPPPPAPPAPPAAPMPVPVAPADVPAPAGPPQGATADTAPRPLATPGPSYPRASLRRGETGEVLLRIHVGANGRTTSVDIVRSSGFQRLDQAAVNAVRRWRFEPATRDGQAVPGEVQVPVDFTPASG